MAVATAIKSLEPIDGAFRCGDDFWDGDQTLWKAVFDTADGDTTSLFVVARGGGFIQRDVVARAIEGKLAEFDQDAPLADELERHGAHPEPAGRRPKHIKLVIEPGDHWHHT
jgi:hypothetical protein